MHSVRRLSPIGLGFVLGWYPESDRGPLPDAHGGTV